jgi:hypothetical protein
LLLLVVAEMMLVARVLPNPMLVVVVVEEGIASFVAMMAMMDAAVV